MDGQRPQSDINQLRHLATSGSARLLRWWDAPTRSIVGATLVAGLLLGLLLFGTHPLG